MGAAPAAEAKWENAKIARYGSHLFAEKHSD